MCKFNVTRWALLRGVSREFLGVLIRVPKKSKRSEQAAKPFNSQRPSVPRNHSNMFQSLPVLSTGSQNLVLFKLVFECLASLKGFLETFIQCFLSKSKWNHYPAPLKTIGHWSD